VDSFAGPAANFQGFRPKVFGRERMARRCSGDGNGRTFRRRKLVRRNHLMTIAAAWVITVPATAAMAGTLFFLIGAIQR
jgi:PiT family inorganic phosphate transporter